MLQGTTLLENGIIEDMPLYLNPNDIRCFVKLPTGKAVVTTLNTSDTPSMIRQKVEQITRIGSLEVAKRACARARICSCMRACARKHTRTHARTRRTQR